MPGSRKFQTAVSAHERWSFSKDLSFPSLRGAKILDELQTSFRETLRLEDFQLVQGHVLLQLKLRPAARVSPLPAHGMKEMNEHQVSLVLALDAVPPNMNTSSAFPSLEHLHELFYQKPSHTGPDGFALHPQKFLIARYGARIVHSRFVLNSNPASHRNSLLCMIIEQDGMITVFEWSAALLQWNLLQRFCFLENINLRWTRPVDQCTVVRIDSTSNYGANSVANSVANGVANTTRDVHFPGNEEAYEIVWRDTSEKSSPAFCSRRFNFPSSDSSLYKTSKKSVLCLETAFTNSSFPSIRRLIHAQNGAIWILCETAVYLRIRHAEHGIPCILSETVAFKNSSNGEAKAFQYQATLHDITQELIVLTESGQVLVFSSNKDMKGAKRAELSVRVLATELEEWHSMALSSRDFEKSTSIQAFRQFLLVLSNVAENRKLFVFSLRHGNLVHSIKLPETRLQLESESESESQSQSQSLNTRFQFWTNPSSAYAVGVWCGDDWYRLHVNPDPIRHQVNARQVSYTELKSYGPSVPLELGKEALIKLMNSANKVHCAASVEEKNKWLIDAEKVCENPLVLISMLDGELPHPRMIAFIEQVLLQIERDVSVGTPYNTCLNAVLYPYLRQWYRFLQLKQETLDKSLQHEKNNTTTASISSTVHWNTTKTSARKQLLHSTSSVSASSSTSSTGTAKKSIREVLSKSTFQLVSATSRSTNKSSYQAACSLYEELNGALMNMGHEDTSPCHLLFHEEPTLALGTSSSSAPRPVYYFEFLCRLYGIVHPSALPSFIQQIHQFSPHQLLGRLALGNEDGHETHCETLSTDKSSLSQRSHIERALSAFGTHPSPLWSLDDLSDEEIHEYAEYTRAYIHVLWMGNLHLEAVNVCKSLGEMQTLRELYQIDQKRLNPATCVNIYICLLQWVCEGASAIEISAEIKAKPDLVTIQQVIQAVRRGLEARKESIESARAKETQDDEQKPIIQVITVQDLRQAFLDLLQK